MSKRRGNDEVLFSLDSFLDIVTNVVGVLVLVAMVTVVSAGNISVPSGATAMTAPKPSAERMLFELSGGEIYFVDEEGNAQRVLDEAKRARDKAPPPPPDTAAGLYMGAWQTRIRAQQRAKTETTNLVALLDGEDVGDTTYRVRAEALDRGLAWIYTLRSEAHGERAADLDRPDSAFRKKLDGLGRGGFAYFVVHDDSFELFGKARDLARARGISVGWHPVEGHEPLRLSALGNLGKRIQ